MEKKSCDVVVIGAGIGGLCLAARLAYTGYRTIVLEKMPILGGRFTYVDYKGYCIPTGALVIYYGWKDPVIQTIKDVGGRYDFDMKEMPPPRWRIGGTDHDTPSKNVLWHLISLASRDKQEEERVITALRRAFRWAAPSDYINFSEWLLRLTDNPTIWNILQAWCVQILGFNLYDVPAGYLVRYFLNFRGGEQLLPKGGLKPIVDSLAKVLIDNNGEIIPSIETQRINVSDGKAVGIEAKGRGFKLEIDARVVVSNVGPKKTVELAGFDNFDRGYLQEIKELRPLEGFWFMVSSDGPLYDWPGGLYAPESRRWQLGIDYSLTWPELAPKGKNWMGFYTIPDHPTIYNPRKEYELFMADLSDLFPNMNKQHAEILLARRFCSDWPNVRVWPSSDRHQKPPVENLYNVGDGVNPAGWMGGSGAAESARIVANDIMGRVKL
ncbi:phytoene desaturase family protein [Chloroflexota bacterium]